MHPLRRACMLYPVYGCMCSCVQVTDQEIYLVVNAGCREKDLEHIGKHLQAAKVRGRL
jgi:bacterioferritin-associated ferredoxin